MSTHIEGLGKTWLAHLNDPDKLVPAVVMLLM